MAEKYDPRKNIEKFAADIAHRSDNPFPLGTVIRFVSEPNELRAAVYIGYDVWAVTDAERRMTYGQLVTYLSGPDVKHISVLLNGEPLK